MVTGIPSRSNMPTVTFEIEKRKHEDRLKMLLGLLPSISKGALKNQVCAFFQGDILNLTNPLFAQRNETQIYEITSILEKLKLDLAIQRTGILQTFKENPELKAAAKELAKVALIKGIYESNASQLSKESSEEIEIRFQKRAKHVIPDFKPLDLYEHTRNIFYASFKTEVENQGVKINDDHFTLYARAARKMIKEEMIAYHQENQAQDPLLNAKILSVRSDLTNLIITDMINGIASQTFGQRTQELDQTIRSFNTCPQCAIEIDRQLGTPSYLAY